MTMDTGLVDHASMERIRWRCRRGLLELDIVLGRFIEHYLSLNGEQKMLFDSLLDQPDNVLWDMICGKVTGLQQDQQALLALINQA
jgi:antitoxin CptB